MKHSSQFVSGDILPVVIFLAQLGKRFLDHVICKYDCVQVGHLPVFVIVRRVELDPIGK